MPLSHRSTADPALHGELARLAGAAEGAGEVLAERADGTVVRVGDRVAKAHAPGTDPRHLAVRVGLAAAEPYAGVLLAPLPGTGPAALPGGRLASLWPYGAPVAPDDPGAAPWKAAGRLLARLHTAPLPAPGEPTDHLAPRGCPARNHPPGVRAQVAPRHRPARLPPMRGPAKAARALARMRRVPGDAHAAAARAVEQAWLALPAWCRAEEPPPHTGTLCHGDFHLGQLVRYPQPAGEWHLIDVDDLGLGDPAWDLARPACWFATGLLPAADWECFLGGYVGTLRATGAGEGLAADDPWPRLDAPARALTVQSAALSLAKAREAGRALDEAEEACVAACTRIAALAVRTELPVRQGP